LGKVNEYYGEIRARNETGADLYFYGDIVSHDSWWNDPEDQWPEKVRAILYGIKGVSNMNIYINSGGGSCFAGMAIYHMLQRHSAHKTVYVDGLAASMASIIALVGDKVIIPADAWMMIHQPWSYAIGNADDMEKDARALRAIEEGMLNAYEKSAKKGVTREQLYSMMQNETWMTGNEAAKHFNIETSPAGKAAAWLGSDFYGRYKNMPEGFTPKPPSEYKSNENITAAKARLKLITTMTGRNKKT
jgi:ATP-dependent protease ClpP protease subunit